MPFGFDDALALGTGIVGAVTGNKAQKKADKYAGMALNQSQKDYDANAPFRNLGRQQLGHAEQAYDMGNLGFNNSNPFAAARGPTKSNAYITGTANNTFDAPLEQPTYQGPANQNDASRQSMTAMLNNSQLPSALRRQIQAKLSALGPASTAPTQTTYGFRP